LHAINIFALPNNYLPKLNLAELYHTKKNPHIFSGLKIFYRIIYLPVCAFLLSMLYELPKFFRGVLVKIFPQTNLKKFFVKKNLPKEKNFFKYPK